MKVFSGCVLTVLVLGMVIGACSNADVGTAAVAGGANAGNGSTTGSGSGLGGSSSGGRPNSGGTASGGAGTGSSSAQGGTQSAGGTTSQGGSSVTGGTKATGGSTATGGVVTGGSAAGGAATGGAAAGGKSAGGTTSNGGAVTTGGAATGGSATGGSATGGKATGGAATGGAATGGAATGGAATGGATATPCSFSTFSNPGNPTYTTYTLPNAQTACGYKGSNNQIKNIVNGSNFAAIPGNTSSDFNTSNRCGACVQIGSAIITIVDECPNDSNPPCQKNPSGHLDLSQSGASAAGVQGDPNKTGQAAWKYVPCPINGNVIVRLKSGNNNEFYIENEILPIASVTCSGQTGSRTSYGAWHFSPNVNGQSCDAKDIAGRSITFTVGNTQDQDVDTKVQFPKCQ
jgi:hypothetical protein